MNAGRNHELRVAKHRPRKIVGEHLGSNGTQRDRRDLLRRTELRINLLRGVRDVVAQRRQSGVEDTGLGGVDGHDPSRAVERLRIRSGKDGNVACGGRPFDLRPVSGRKLELRYAVQPFGDDDLQLHAGQV